MSAKTIYDRLRSHGMTVAGACAMLGNMNAETASITAKTARSISAHATAVSRSHSTSLI